MLKRHFPARLYICPECDYRTELRWVLARHLMLRHGLGRSQARYEAALNEYLANPVAYSRQAGDYHAVETKKEDRPMEKLHPLRRILDTLEDKGIDPDKVVITPKSVHVIASDDDDDDDEDDED